MARHNRCVASVLLVLILLLLPIAASAEGRIFKVNSSSGLNLRYETNDRSWIVATLSKGSKVREIMSKGNWMYVETRDGDYGYCYKKYLTLSGRPLSDPDEQAKFYGDFVYVNKAGGVKAHRSPASWSKALGKIGDGSIVVLLTYSGNWGYIETMSGNKGYVELMYLNKFSG